MRVEGEGVRGKGLMVRGYGLGLNQYWIIYKPWGRQAAGI